MASEDTNYEDNVDAGVDGADDKPVAGADSTAHFEPLVHLAQVEVKTGEEDEDALYKERAKLYRFDANVKEWKERGTGDVKLLQHKENKKVRLLLRQEKTLKICMNHLVHPTLELKPNLGSDRAWTWTTLDYSSDPPSMQTFAIKFKNAEVANAFKEHYAKAATINKGLAVTDSSAPAEAKHESNPWDTILNDRKFSPLTEEDIKTLWAKYDKDGSKYVDGSELKNLISDLMQALLKVVKASLNEEQTQQLEAAIPALAEKTLSALDHNSDKKLSWDEFKSIDTVKMAL